MKTIRLALISFVSAIGALVASAQQAPTSAYVSSLTGTATYTAPGSTESAPLVSGQALPEGSVVATGEASSLIIVSHQGIETGIGAKSTAAVGTHSVSADGVRTAVIDLKEGTTVSVLDPTKRATNNYAIRTPKGVAAARGTTYSTSVKLSSGGEAIVTVNTLTGNVSFSIVNSDGTAGKTVSVAAGNSANSNKGVSTSIAQAISEATTPEAKAEIAEALNATVAVASIIANVTTGSEGAKANNTLREVVENVTKAANEVAATDSATATALVTATVTTVRELAGDSAKQAVQTIETNSTNADVKAAASAAATAPVEVKTVTVTPQTDAAPEKITADGPTTTPAQPTIDITTIVTPSTPAP